MYTKAINASTFIPSKRRNVGLNKIFLFLLCMLSVFSVNAQKWHIGLISGINFPNIYAKKESGLSNLSSENKKRTFISGIGLSYACNKNLAIRSEFFYEERGWLVKNTFSIDPGNGNPKKSKINYFYPFITMPMLIEFKVGKHLQLIVNTGINTSLRIGGRTITEDGGIPLVFIFPEDKKPIFDFGWVGGGGISVPISKRFFLQTEYRYYRSWTPIGVGYSFDSVLKHKGFLLNLSCYYRM